MNIFPTIYTGFTVRSTLQTEDWREQIITSFRDCSMMDEEDLEDYERQEGGEPTDESILRHAGQGQIHLIAEPEGDYVNMQTYFGVDWDEEHGLEIAWDADTIAATEATTHEDTSFSCGKVQISGSGPALTGEQIAAFEKNFSIRLPNEYRQFLLLQNGGIPGPNHLAIRREGTDLPVDVKRFYSMRGTDQSVDRSLEMATAELRNRSLPQELLPVGEVHTQNLGPMAANAELVLVVSGKNAGQLFVFDSASLRMPFATGPTQAMGIPLEFLLSMSIKAAKSWNDLFERLQARPEVKSPEWFQLIQQERTEEFLEWVRGGGKLTDSFKDYGQPVKMSVIDYLARDASPEMLNEMVAAKIIKPKQLRDSWLEHQAADVGRFKELMAVLPSTMWSQVLISPMVWDRPDVLEQLAAAGVDFNAPVNDEGAPPLHLAVQFGHRDAVRWLIAHGADVHKEDKFQRTAFIWAENGPGYECLPLLEGKDENPAPPREPLPDVPGILALWQAAQDLPKDQDVLISIQLKAPAVTRVEKTCYDECLYRLSFYVRGDKAVYNDMNSGRQDYLYAGKWPTFLFCPILQWPALTPLWPTLQVQEFDWSKAVKKRNYEGPARPDLIEHARSALEQAFNTEEAAARGIRLRK